MTAQTSESPLLERIHELRRAADDAAVLLSLHETGVLGALAQSPQSIPELAAQLQLDERRLGAFLDVSVALNLIRQEDGCFSLYPEDVALFSTDRVADIALPGKSVAAFFESRKRFPDLLRGAAAPSIAGSGGDVDTESRENFLRYLDGLSQDGAQEVVRLCEEEPPTRILDIGGGAGTYSHALLQRFPDCEAFLVDRPNAEGIVGQLAGERGVGDRLHFCGIDFLLDPLPESVDLVLLSNIVHCYGPENNRKLLGRVAKVMAPGGRVIIKDLKVEEDRSGPISALRFAVYMVVATQAGNVYSAEMVAQWCREAGLVPQESLSLQAADAHYAVIARRPVG